jgi:hypothetical protein
MANDLVTNYFRLHNVKQFKESINESANSVYYVFAGRHLPYPQGDQVVPLVPNSVDSTFYAPYQQMLFGKRVTTGDIVTLTRRHDWTANTVYTPYRSSSVLSSTSYYVGVTTPSAYHVFKCLDNNGGSKSLYAPDITQTSADDEYYSTNDGYVWKYMYSVDTSTFSKFATEQYVPVVANSAVVGNASPGSIDVVVVDYKGSHYNTYLSNTFHSTDLRVGGDPIKYNIANNAVATNNYYIGSMLYIKAGSGYGQGQRIVDYVVVGTTKTVTLANSFTIAPDVTSQYEITPGVLIAGDGSGAQARALVNAASSNSVYAVEIIQRGAGYSYASAIVTGNTNGSTNSAVLSVVMGPKGGHGSDPEYELNGSAVGISVTFNSDESNTIPITNDYRQVGLLKDPLYANVSLTVATATGAFQIGETVTQQTTLATGVVTEFDGLTNLQLTNVNGVFMTGYRVEGATTTATANVTLFEINGLAKNFNTFDQRYKFTYTPTTGVFVKDEVVYQTDMQLTNAYFHSNSSNYIYLTDIRGTLNTGNTLIGQNSGATANLLYSYPPDLVVGSGEILYLENYTPITRANSQSETIKLILQF